MLATGSDENFRWAWEFAHERAYGKAQQHVEMELNDFTNRPSAEQLDAALRSLRDNPEGAAVDRVQ